MLELIGQLILAYLFGIAVLTVFIIAATSNRYRRHFRWLVQDEPKPPMTSLEWTIHDILENRQPR